MSLAVSRAFASLSRAPPAADPRGQFVADVLEGRLIWLPWRRWVSGCAWSRPSGSGPVMNVLRCGGWPGRWARRAGSFTCCGSSDPACTDLAPFGCPCRVRRFLYPRRRLTAGGRRSRRLMRQSWMTRSCLARLRAGRVGRSGPRLAGHRWLMPEPAATHFDLHRAHARAGMIFPPPRQRAPPRRGSCGEVRVQRFRPLWRAGRYRVTVVEHR